jgi:hypothetical protein
MRSSTLQAMYGSRWEKKASCRARCPKRGHVIGASEHGGEASAAIEVPSEFGEVARHVPADGMEVPSMAVIKLPSTVSTHRKGDFLGLLVRAEPLPGRFA